MEEPNTAQAVEYEKVGKDPVFARKEDLKGYNVKAWYLKCPHNTDALVEIFKDGEIVRTFLFPAYKIYNIAAHFEDIVESEINGDAKGYEAAAWCGL